MTRHGLLKRRRWCRQPAVAPATYLVVSLTRQYDLTPLSDDKGVFVGIPSLVDVANAYFCAYDFVAYDSHRLDELETRQTT